uniref:Uncharacterized protein n=1 Tax=Anopheles atroparvus TaxID=41427 RepID=A0A182IN69_ANOAO
MPQFVFSAGGEDGIAHTVRVAVGARAAILQVALLGVGNTARDAHRAATVRHTPAELVDRGRLQAADQPTLVVLSTARIVRLDVLVMLGRELLDGSLDRLDAALGTHRFGGEVAVAAGPVPVALHRLRVERHDDAVVLGDAPQNVARQPEVVRALHAECRPDLVLPLRRHHLSVGAGELDARIQTGDRVCLGDVARHHVLGAGGAVVGALRPREPVHRPAEWAPVHVQEGVLLLDAEPRLQLLGAVVRVLHGRAVVRGGRLAVRLSSTRSFSRTFSPVPSIQTYVACTYLGSYFRRVYLSSSVLLRCAFGECSRMRAHRGPPLVLIMRTDDEDLPASPAWPRNIKPTTRRAIFSQF